ncbi:MAG: histidine phosphatase family protein [Oscillospiraceae bacterium]|nr:histidine phosphatase family protein [Oscillospiraceae bacterium]
MTTLYLIRHGESQANEKDVFIGHTDLELTDLGRKQAEITADYLKNITPDVIYSSDLRRAYNTAEATAKQYGMEICIEPGLREIYAGDWEYVPFAQLEAQCKETYGIWCKDVANARCDNGESVTEVYDRVSKTIRKIAMRHPDATVFIFSHATPVRTFAIHSMGKTVQELPLLPWPSNASVTRVTFDGEKFSLLEYSTDHFMGTLATRLPDNV